MLRLVTGGWSFGPDHKELEKADIWSRNSSVIAIPSDETCSLISCRISVRRVSLIYSIFKAGDGGLEDGGTARAWQDITSSPLMNSRSRANASSQAASNDKVGDARRSSRCSSRFVGLSLNPLANCARTTLSAELEVDWITAPPPVEGLA